MRCHVPTLVLALIAGAGLAAAQAPPAQSPDESITHPAPGSLPSTAAPLSQLQLTAAQKTAILNAIRGDSGKGGSPVNFVVAVGAPVPPSIELYVLPDAALADVPEAKIVKYTRMQNQVVLVDPTTMRVVDVLRESGP